MKQFLRRFPAFLLCLALLLPLALSAAAAEEEPLQAKDISHKDNLLDSGNFQYTDAFFDREHHYYRQNGENPWFTVGNEEGIGSVYIIFQDIPGAYTVTNNDTGEVAEVGKYGFIHDFLDMQALFGSCPQSVTISFAGEGITIIEVYLFTPGEVPDFVQKWSAPVENETDLVLFSTHGDDEHLFFAGILPYYGVEQGLQVQVVYLTDHLNYTSVRIHEMLNGLWAVGIDTYPVFGGFYDFHAENMYAAYRKFFSQGVSEADLIGFVVEQMRRFKPKVVVAHDFNGEYGHAQHKVYADLVAKALEISNDPEKYPELADKYGTWDVPKAYFHLYWENKIVMDWDQPMEKFGGETPFMVSIYRGFQCHRTQVPDFMWFYYGYPDAKSLQRYNPCYYGLYRSTVGEDVEKNDFFENVTTYAQDRQAEQERVEKLEQERLEAERKEQERLEAEKKAREEAERLAAEAAAKAAEEAARLEAERLAAQKQARIRRVTKEALLCAAALAAAIVTVLWLQKRKKR